MIGLNADHLENHGSKFICSSDCNLNDTFVLTISADNCVSDESEGNGSYNYVSGNCPIFYNSLFNRSNYNIEQTLYQLLSFAKMVEQEGYVELVLMITVYLLISLMVVTSVII